MGGPNVRWQAHGSCAIWTDGRFTVETKKSEYIQSLRSFVSRPIERRSDESPFVASLR
jgi:hypothetical protein